MPTITRRTNIQAFDTAIMNNKNIADIQKYIDGIQISGKVIREIGPTLMIRAIKHDNLPFFTHLLNEHGVDADVVDPDLQISPMDYLTGMWNLTSNQSAMLDAVNNHPKRAKASRVPVAQATANSSIMKCIARFWTIEEFETFFKSSTGLLIYLDDGSNSISQAIIGNNLDFIKGFFRAWKSNINDRWASKKVVPDIVGIYGINPVGWTHLMLAVALNRIEIAEYLIVELGADANLGHGALNPIELALTLPEALRPPMIAVIQKSKAFESTDLPSSTPQELKVSLLGSSGKGGFAENYIKTRTNLDLETIKCFVAYGTPNSMRSALAISPEIAKKYEIHKCFWDGLKMDKTSTADDLAAKISMMSVYGFRLDDRRLFGDDKTPWHEIVVTPVHAEYERLISAMMKCTGLFNINLIEPECDYPVFTGISKGNYTLAKEMLRYAIASPDHKYVAFYDSGAFNGTKCLQNRIAMGCPDTDTMFLSCKYGEKNLLHTSIIYIPEEDQIIKIIDLLKEINPGYISSVATLSSMSAYYFNVNGFHACYRTDKRCNWTGLMFALFQRKDKVGKHLVCIGAPGNKAGDDGIAPNMILKMRGDAMKNAIYDPNNKKQGTLLNDEALKEYIKLMRTEFKTRIDEDLNNTLNY